MSYLHSQTSGGYRVLQHHDDKFDLHDRLYTGATRVDDKDDETGEWIPNDEYTGDILCGRVFKARKGKREMAAWAYAWPSVVWDWEQRQDPKKVITGPGAEGKFHLSILPIRRDHLIQDDRLEQSWTDWPDWRQWFPVGYQTIGMQGSDEATEQHLTMSADESLICPGRAGPGEMANLVHDVEEGGSMVRAGPPGVGGYGARLSTAWRVVRIESLGDLDLTTPHNTICINLGPTEQDGEVGGKNRARKGFAGLGSFYGLVSKQSSKKDKDDDDGPVITGEGGASDNANPSGDVPVVERIPDDQGGGSPGGGKWERAVAFGEKFAFGPFNVGHGKKDKHKHGETKDGEVISPLHLDTLAYWVDRSDAEKDAPLEFRKEPYIGGRDHAIPTPVYLRYNSFKQHPWISGKATGLWMWETTVPYISSPPDRREPPDITPPREPREPNDPEPPPRTPGDTTPGGGDPLADDDPGGGEFGPPGIFPGPVTGQGSGPPATGSPDGGESTNRDERFDDVVPYDDESPWDNYPRWVVDDDGELVPFDENNPEHWRWWREGRGRGSKNKSYITTANHAAYEVESHIWHPQTQGFATNIWRPQDLTPNAADLRRHGGSTSQITRDEARRPAVIRMEAYGAGSETGWTYGQMPGASRVHGGTAGGGVVILPPELDILDVKGGASPSGVATSDAYMTFAPGSYLGFGFPDTSGGGVQDCGYRIGYDEANSEVVVGSLASSGSSGTESPAMRLGKVGSDPAVGFFDTTPAIQQSTFTAPSAPSISGGDTIDSGAQDTFNSSVAQALSNIKTALQNYGLMV